MIELIIKAESAQEISVEVQELANQLTGTHKCKHETVETVEPVKAEPKKTAKVEEKTYTVDEVRAAAKDFVQKDPANKKKLAEFLHNELGVKSITEAPADVHPRIIEFVGAN